MRSASGFPCPRCHQEKLAYIDGADVVHILELRCPQCGMKWAVEQAYPTPPGGFMDPKGMVT